MSDRAMSDILGDVVRDIQDLFRSEVRLARAEALQQAGRLRSVGGLFGAAAVVALLAGMCLATCLVAALALVLPLWEAALVVMFVLGGTAAILLMLGRSKLRNVRVVPTQTVETIKEDVQWAKHQIR
jgi:Putative Actinobacterial Holin-X, holin superfamily III